MVRSVLREAEKKELLIDGFDKAGQGQVINKSLAAGHTWRFSHPLHTQGDVLWKSAHLYRIFCKMELATSKDSSFTRTIS